MKEIASITGHDRNAISRAIKSFGISKQNNYVQYDNALDDEWIDLYVDKRMSTAQIASMYGVSHSTVKKHLLRCGIEVRGYSESQRNSRGKSILSSDLDDHDIMYNLYVDKKYDLKQIGELYDCTAKAVRDKLVSLGIPIRTLSETRIGRYAGADHPNWQGGITPLTMRLREYFNEWLVPVIRQRDQYCCQLCGKKSNLHVHHIVSFSHIVHQILDENHDLDPVNNVNELYNIAKQDQRFLDTNNLITYCMECHLYKIHKYKRTISIQAS